MIVVSYYVRFCEWFPPLAWYSNSGYAGRYPESENFGVVGWILSFRTFPSF